MRRIAALGTFFIVIAMALPAAAQTQRGRGAAKPKPAAKPAPQTEAAKVTCPEALGVGLGTKASFCFVLAGRDPAEGVLIDIPPNSQATLTFDIHNRHTYSEEEVRAGRGFARYSAGIGILTMSGNLLGRGAVQSEFRTVKDLFDRIGGGAGPGGVKAVAPLGREQVSIPIPSGVDRVSLLGELLDATTSAGREIATPGRPVAIISNVEIHYVPAPPKRGK
jgi:hypothetical protein